MSHGTQKPLATELRGEFFWLETFETATSRETQKGNLSLFVYLFIFPTYFVSLSWI